MVGMRNTKTGQFASRDFTGVRSGKLTVVRATGERDKWGYALWEMACDCGNTIIRTCQRLTLAKPMQSCGCAPRGRTPRQSHVEAMYKRHQHAAKARKLAFEIADAEHAKLIASDCAYCGAKPTNRPHPYLRVKMIHNGIDRIDPALGYVPGNVAPCCPTCNFAKGTMTGVEFKAWVARVYGHLHR